MIFKNIQYENFLKNPSGDIKAILIYGPNEGLISERFDKISSLIVNDIDDPFRVVNLSSDNIDNDKSLLLSEFSAMPFTGGRKIIRIKNASNNITSIFKDLVFDLNNQNFIVLSAGELKPQSSLRKTFETHSNMAAIPCYNDDISDIANIIQNIITKNGHSISSDALSFTASHLGSDRKTIHSEIEKLCLYMGDKKEITINEVKNCIGDSADLTNEDLCYAIAEGKHEAVQRILENLFAEGNNPVSIIRITSSFFQKIYLTCDKVAQGMSSDSAMKTLKPAIMFKRAPAFQKIIEHWSPTTASKALSLLLAAEIGVKTTAYPQEIICAKYLAQITGAGYEIMKKRIRF
ncbi:MAG: DNA polymerase III subunit delta [Alphaproteobacteria bacterium]